MNTALARPNDAKPHDDRPGKELERLGLLRLAGDDVVSSVVARPASANLGGKPTRWM